MKTGVRSSVMPRKYPLLLTVTAVLAGYNLPMSGKENLDNLMRKVVKVSPEELKRRLEAEKRAKAKPKGSAK